MKKKLNFFITLLGFYAWKVRIKLVQTPGVSQFWKQFIEDFKINPLTPMSDQDRISP